MHKSLRYTEEQHIVYIYRYKITHIGVYTVAPLPPYIDKTVFSLLPSPLEKSNHSTSAT